MQGDHKSEISEFNLKFRCAAENHYQKNRKYDDGVSTYTQNEQV